MRHPEQIGTGKLFRRRPHHQLLLQLAHLRDLCTLALQLRLARRQRVAQPRHSLVRALEVQAALWAWACCGTHASCAQERPMPTKLQVLLCCASSLYT